MKREKDEFKYHPTIYMYIIMKSEETRILLGCIIEFRDREEKFIIY